MNFYKMNKKTIIAGSAVTLGLSGLAWLVNESVVRKLQKSALHYNLEAMTTKNLYDFLLLQEIGEKRTRQASIAKKIQSLNPLSHIIPYARRFYLMYLKDYDKARQY